VRDDWPGALAQHVADAAPPRLYALLPARAGPDPPAGGALATRLARHGPIGLSPACADPAALGRALLAAGLAVDLPGAGAGAAPGPPWPVRTADDAPVRAHYEATLAPLVRYDAVYDTDLVPTVALLTAAAGDAGAVAAELGVPAHRVRYRLEKVRELSGLQAAVPADRRALELGVRCWRVLAPELPG
jgi:hypothetical protein